MNASQEQPSSEKRHPHDRRDSPRVPFRLLVRCAVDGEPYEESKGDLSTGGVFWGTAHVAHAKDVEVLIPIPGERQEIHARGEIVGRRDAGFHVRFTTLGTDEELAIARYIDEVGIGWD